MSNFVSDSDKRCSFLTIAIKPAVENKQRPFLLFLNSEKCAAFCCLRWSKDDLPGCFSADCPGGPTSGAASTCSCGSGPQQGAKPLQRAAHTTNITAAALLR